jgi:hypothetical protein
MFGAFPELLASLRGEQRFPCSCKGIPKYLHIHLCRFFKATCLIFCKRVDGNFCHGAVLSLLSDGISSFLK